MQMPLGNIHRSVSIHRRGTIKFKILRIMLAIIAALVIVTACQIPDKGVPRLKVAPPAEKFYVVGHRGAAGLAPENTLASFRRALQIGVDAVELDVLLTADGEVVVHHDFHLKPDIARTPDGEWLKLQPTPSIKELTLGELKTYDVGRLKPFTKYSNRYPEQVPVDGERIPTLRELIFLLKNNATKNTQLWIEIKTNPEKPDFTPPPETVADAVVQLLRKQDFTGRVRILSFDWRSLVHIQKIAPDIPTVYLSLVGRSLNNIKPGQPGASPWMAGIDIDDFSGSIPRAVKAVGGRHWAPYYKHITYNLLKEAHELGLQVFVWSPDSHHDMKRLIEMGVDGIITNRPDILKAVIGKDN